MDLRFSGILNRPLICLFGRQNFIGGTLDEVLAPDLHFAIFGHSMTLTQETEICRGIRQWSSVYLDFRFLAMLNAPHVPPLDGWKLHSWSIDGLFLPIFCQKLCTLIPFFLANKSLSLVLPSAVLVHVSTLTFAIWASNSKRHLTCH